MKQILIISRIGDGDDEFPEFFSNQAPSVPINYGEFSLSFYNGLEFYCKDDNREIAKRIGEKVSADAERVTIIIHYSEFALLSGALINISGGAKWEICEYTSVGDDPTYDYNTVIKPLFSGLLKDPSNAEEIYNLFSSDPVLERKLALLNSIVNDETVDGKNIDQLKIKGEDYFAALDKETDFAEYKRAYDQFYDDLDIEN